MIYTEKKITDDRFLREFPDSVDETELYWHRDKRDRRVKVVEGMGWKLQLDNSLPVELIEGSTHMIPKDVFHRLWRGQDRLVVEIVELDK